MKKLFFAVSAIAALSLLAPSTGFAQFEFSNQVGLFLTGDGAGGNGTMTVGAPVTTFLVLTKPTDVENGEAPYTSVNFFECRLNFNPVGGLLKTGEVLPPTGINNGDSDHIGDGFLEYIVAMTDDYPVTDESVSLVTIQFLSVVATPIEVTLGPATVQSIPDEMSFMSIVGDPRVMYPVSGDIDEPVFCFGSHCYVLPVENEPFGSVKALYR